MADISSEKIEAEVKRIVKEELEDYFRMARPGFTLSSGHKTKGHGIAEFCMTTDSIQGMHFYKQGNVKMKANKSFEVYSGESLRSIELDRFAIVLDAETGHIKIVAKSGDVVIEGDNVKINASDTLQLSGDRIVNVLAPSVEIEGTGGPVKITAHEEIDILGGSVSIHSESAAPELSGGEDQIANTDLISRIINLIDDLKRIGVFTA